MLIVDDGLPGAWRSLNKQEVAMRRLIFGISTALLLTGCNTLEGVSTLMNFSDHPVAAKAAEGSRATKQDILAIQQPKRITPVRNGSSQCFDYELENKGKKKDLYVSFTDTGTVNAYGYITCAEAIKGGYLNSNEPSRQIY
ncbi:lipoprotein [Pseudomonas antarctica]|nr:lipoprotein [Pseudomonas antarctica]